MEEENQTNLSMSEDQSLDIHNEDEGSEKQVFTKAGKLIGNLTPLLPKRVKEVAKMNQTALEEALSTIVQQIESSQFEDQLDNIDLENKTAATYQSILEGLWIAFNIFDNFKVNVHDEIYGKILLLALKTLQAPKTNLLLTNKILKILGKFPIFYFNLDLLVEFADSSNLWKKFYSALYEKDEFAEKSAINQRDIIAFRTHLRKLLQKGLNKIFKNKFEEIYGQMRRDKINFFGLALKSSNVQLMNCLIPLGNLGQQELAIVIKDFRFYVDKVAIKSKFIIMVSPKFPYVFLSSSLN